MKIDAWTVSFLLASEQMVVSFLALFQGTWSDVYAVIFLLVSEPLVIAFVTHFVFF